MRRGLSFIMALATTACQSAPPAPDAASQSPASGRQLLESHCSACHAIGRTDQSRHHDAPAFRTLGRRYPILSLEESLAEGIVVGHPDMPEFKFEASQVASIISYLESIQQD